MTLTKTKDGKTYELIRFPMKTMTITQGNNGQYSHQGVNALDIAGKDAGIDPTFAPCKMRIARKEGYANGNAVFAESVDKVMFADGTVDYAKFMFLHDNYTGDFSVGRVFQQWEEFGDEGTAGYATGNHCHFEVAKGKLVWDKAGSGYGYYGRNNSTGVWHLQDSISADKACVVDGVTIKNGNGMGWKKASEVKNGSSGSIKWTAENGTATFTRNNIRIHEDGPTGKVIAGVQYNAGQSVKYFAKCAYAGHRWVKYHRAGGGVGCVAVSGSETRGVDPWATFK
ncbi:hypothetical protein [Faecalibaculum rodentium]|uniref:hypothetical protein n=1 Tax=Faecalibaculum rodentium TaxID=1702221 RepID=UPI0023F2FF76|nr:hypothetical protein [Faecalibaculum rodentium]